VVYNLYPSRDLEHNTQLLCEECSEFHLTSGSLSFYFTICGSRDPQKKVCVVLGGGGRGAVPVGAEWSCAEIVSRWKVRQVLLLWSLIPICRIN
jgi:hypothetical protein